MMRFIKLITYDELWPKVCVREEGKEPLDGAGCTEGSYNNMTHYIEPYLGKYPDEFL